MANAIKPLHASPSALTISLASLASSTSGVGQQSTEVDNTTNRYGKIELSVSVKLGTSPTANRCVYVHFVRSNADSTPIRDDGAGSTNAGHTAVNAPVVLCLFSPTGTTGTTLSGTCVVDDPGPKWLVSINHDTGVALDSTAGNHVVSFIGINPEIQ